MNAALLKDYSGPFGTRIMEATDAATKTTVAKVSYPAGDGRAFISAQAEVEETLQAAGYTAARWA